MLDTQRVPPAPSDPLDPPLQLLSIFTPTGAQEVILSVRLSSLSAFLQSAHTYFSNIVGPFQHLVLILEHYKGPPDQYDAEMWWQNLRKWGKSEF